MRLFDGIVQDVPGAGLEPARPKSQDFKSCMSTNSIIRAGMGKMEASAGFEPAIELLQSPALGHLATTPYEIKDYRRRTGVNRKTITPMI